jgi:hypothetical protein
MMKENQMSDLRAIMASVDYNDLLPVTLAYNIHHFKEVNIVTSHRDLSNVKQICWDLPNPTGVGINIMATDLFYADGARFNKWRALEWMLDQVGRDGWLCVMDADVLWPKKAQVTPYLHKGCLFGPLRRMCVDLTLRWDHSPMGESTTLGSDDEDIRPFPPEDLWRDFPVHRNVGEWAGYTQIFHSSDPVLGPAPWHEIDWSHAGGADSFFQRKWPKHKKVRPPWEVLHLGPAGANWMGRASNLLDGTKPPLADRCKQLLEQVWVNRHKNRDRVKYQQMGSELFADEKIDLT